MLRLILKILIYVLLAWLLCDIDPGKHYTWYSGIWHGFFLPINFLRSLMFEDVYYKAEFYTTAYSVWFWICGVSSVFSFVFDEMVVRSDRK